MSKLIPIIIVFLALLLLWPHNKISYFVDSNGDVRLSRLDRRSILLNYGTYFTPGYYSNLLTKPDIYVRPTYEGGALDLGCFDFVFEFNNDTVFVYPGGAYKANLNGKFQLIELPNAFGNKSWLSIRQDMSNKYLKVDCNTYTNIIK